MNTLMNMFVCLAVGGVIGFFAAVILSVTDDDDQL